MKKISWRIHPNKSVAKKLQVPDKFLSVGYVKNFKDMLVIDEVHNVVCLPHISISGKFMRASFIQERVYKAGAYVGQSYYKIQGVAVRKDQLWPLIEWDSRMIYLNQIEELCLTQKQQARPLAIITMKKTKGVKHTHAQKAIMASRRWKKRMGLGSYSVHSAVSGSKTNPEKTSGSSSGSIKE